MRELLGRLGEDAIKRRKIEDEARRQEEKEHQETTWYHEGPQSLKVKIYQDIGLV